MSGRHSVLVATIALVLFVTSLVVISSDNPELDVYSTYLESPDIHPHVQKLAIVSVISTCERATPDRTASSEMIRALRHANSNDSKPIKLLKLADKVNVVDHSIAVAHHQNEISSINTDFALLNISRVGFNEDMTQAIFCIETLNSAGLAILSKQGSGYWEIDQYKQLWIN